MSTIVDPVIVRKIVETPSSDFTRRFILDLCAVKKDGSRQFSPDDIVDILPEFKYASGKLKEPVKSTLGCLLVNKLLFERVFHVLGYVNKVLNKKTWFGIVSQLDNALVLDRITGEEYIEVMDMRESVGNTLNSFFTPTPTMKTFIPPKEVMELRDKLVEEHKVALENGDPIVASNIERQLLDKAKEVMKNDPSMDLYNSGAASSFDNNYKSRIFNGPVMDPLTGKFNILTGNYYSGTPVKDIPVLATSMVSGAYAKGVGTAVGGYMVKQANAAFQTSVFDSIGTDCGTKKHLIIKLTDRNYIDFLYRYVIDGAKTVMLTLDNYDKYVNTTVAMRDPTCCAAKEKICSKCSGEYLQKIQIENAGLTASTLYNSLVNKSMKKFHDISLKTYTIKDVNSLLIKLN